MLRLIFGQLRFELLLLSKILINDTPSEKLDVGRSLERGHAGSQGHPSRA